MENFLDLAVFPTSRCDTGCRHCLDDCGLKNPVDFKPEMAEELLADARRNDLALSVLFTGYGEPLMAPHLIEIAEIFGAYEKTAMVNIITSGFSDADKKRRESFGKIIGSLDKRRQLCLSFNLFHKSFPERLKNMVEMFASLKEEKKLYRMAVRMCVALDNFRETWDAFNGTLDAVAIHNGFIHRFASIRLEMEERDSLEILEDYMGDQGRLAYGATLFESYLQPQWHYMVFPKTNSYMAIYVKPTILVGFGRAKNTKHVYLKRFDCRAIRRHLRGDGYLPLVVFPDGNVFAECCTRIRLGKVGEDSVSEMRRRYKRLVDNLFPALIADKRMYKKDSDEICRICESLAHRNAWLNV